MIETKFRELDFNNMSTSTEEEVAMYRENMSLYKTL